MRLENRFDFSLQADGAMLRQAAFCDKRQDRLVVPKDQAAVEGRGNALWQQPRNEREMAAMTKLFKRLYGQRRNGGAEAIHPREPSFTVPRGSRLHLACGNRVVPGWVNLDLYRPPAGTIPFSVTQYPWPIEAESVTIVYSEDLFEHLAQQDQIRYLAETARVPVKGGIVRIVAPDLAHSLPHRILVIRVAINSKNCLIASTWLQKSGFLANPCRRGGMFFAEASSEGK
jgi:hypothetical protein